MGTISISWNGCLRTPLLITLLLVSILCISAAPRPQHSKADHLDLDTPQGRLRGYTKISRQGREYTAFYQVPYAEPPLNSLRFKDPVAPKVPSWSGLRDIPTVAPQCIQKDKSAVVDITVGVEDCLYANIYIPSIIQSNDSSYLQNSSLPVMVYIHGGGFVDGNGSRYGAEYFMDENVILITFQYRLGPFGFLNTNDDVIHGNMAFKDQIQMLLWVHENIKYYGGDNTRVTIFGNSAGAIGTAFLMLSPMATGLFHGAITQSGPNITPPLDPSMIIGDPLQTVKEVGRLLNCTTDNTTQFLECLVTKDASDIALARTPLTSYYLTLETRNDSQVFMPDTPYNLLKLQANPVPYIIGINNAEALGSALAMLSSTELVDGLNDHFEILAKQLLGVDMTTEELLRIKSFYFGEKSIGNDTIIELSNLMSDRTFIHSSYTSAIMHSKFGPTYLYYVSKPPAKSYADKVIPGFPAKELGLLSHADELQYFFLYDGYPEISNGDPEYYEFSSYLVKLWATFAATGSPNLNNITWETVDSSSNSTFWFELNDNPGRTDIIRDRMNFWDQFSHEQLKYETLNRLLFYDV